MRDDVEATGKTDEEPEKEKQPQVALPGVKHKFSDGYVVRDGVELTGKTDEEPGRGESRQISGGVAR